MAPATAGAMKAVLTDRRFSDPNWIYERKLDGIRCIAIRDGGPVRLLSRNDLSLNDRFPSIAAALPQGRYAIDGEIVGYEHGDFVSFTRLGHGDVVYAVFDITWLDGRDVRDLPLLERKALLETLPLSWPVQRTEWVREHGEALFEHACKSGWEGVIAKRADSKYVPARSRDWLKFKCSQGQELVIGGFTAPRGARTDFGALLVGVYDDTGALRYAGKVGTGFTRETLASLGARLRALARDSSPFADAPRLRDATWVEPVLVGQFAFAEWTPAGRLRHPRFVGLRDDKDAREVVREG
jgi:bifunctional non-homologous end joining protein LigD